MTTGHAWNYDEIRAWLASVRARTPKRERIVPEPDPVDDYDGVGPIEEMNRYCAEAYGT